VAQPFVRRVGRYAVALAVTAACSAKSSEIQQHAEKMNSLRATTIAVTNAWLAGSVSGTYTRATFERTFQLVDQERAAAAATPEDLALPAANAVVREGEQLARNLAALSDAVGREDGSSTRRLLDELPRPGSE
jgi:hypothetical protein